METGEGIGEGAAFTETYEPYTGPTTTIYEVVGEFVCDFCLDKPIKTIRKEGDERTIAVCMNHAQILQKVRGTHPDLFKCDRDVIMALVEDLAARKDS